ncbi:hypothetical protein [Phenylobacterium conjunctum]|jgi:hypothetical protein|uniref:Uncharacterized protein n=1 Tax=Phenylobacterium conjunctum TaxID=1298959 RepID=A0ABW3SWP7_9CAUL
MNASLRLFVTNRLTRRALRVGVALGCLSAAAGVAGCASGPFAPASLDKASAASAEISTLASAAKTYPTFADIPPPPADVRPDRAWGKAAAEVEGDGAALAAATAPSTWTLSATDSFAARALAAAGPGVEGPDSTTAATEAFAKQARQRATPPPPPKK